MTNKQAKHFLKEFLGDKPNFREDRPGQDEEVYRQMDMLAEAIDVAISALEGKDTDVPSKDTIYRRAAIDALNKEIIKRRLLDDVNDGMLDEFDTEDILRKLPPAQPERIQNNAVHLCDSCQYTYVTCPSHGNDAVFGDGKGNDNICACNKYRPISAQSVDKAYLCDWFINSVGGEPTWTEEHILELANDFYVIPKEKR